MAPTDDATGLALVEEALRKSSVLWLTLPSLAVPRIAWHVWLDGAAYVVHEGIEQRLPGLYELARVEISLRSKDTGTLLTRWTALVEPVPPDDPGWPRAVAALHAHRQSPPDGPAQPARWAVQSRVTRLVPLR